MDVRQQLEADTRAIALEHGRRVGKSGHGIAREYLLGRLGEIGLSPFHGSGFELPYERAHPVSGIATQFTNLVARIGGEDPNLKPLLIGAHYDSVIDAPCADDNAAAVAVTLSAASALKMTPLNRDVIVALFDAEEPPFFLGDTMGSVRFFEDHCSGMDFAAAVIMDLVGHDVELSSTGFDDMVPGVKDLLFIMGSESHPSLPGVVERAAVSTKRLRIVPTLNRYVGDMSDHYAFRKAGQPFLFLSCGQGKYYHDPLDTAEWVNFAKLVHVHELVLHLAEELDRDGAPGSGPAGETAAFEIAMLEKAVGPAFPRVLDLIGLEKPRNRADLDALAGFLRQALVV